MSETNARLLGCPCCGGCHFNTKRLKDGRYLAECAKCGSKMMEDDLLQINRRPKREIEVEKYCGECGDCKKISTAGQGPTCRRYNEYIHYDENNGKLLRCQQCLASEIKEGG